MKGLLLLLILLSVPPQDDKKPNEMCPVMEGQPIDRNYFANHEGRTIYFCCEDCRIVFFHEPEKYMARLKLPEQPSDSWIGDPRVPSFLLLGLSLVLLILSIWKWEKRLRVATAAGLVSAGLLLVLSYSARLMFSWSDSDLSLFHANGLILLSLAVPLGTAATWGASWIRKRRPAEAGPKDARKVVLAGLVIVGAFGILTWRIPDLILPEPQDLEEDIQTFEAFLHHSIFDLYGEPPVPERIDKQPGLSRLYYRGNDDRRDALWNRGHFRTCVFRLTLTDMEGKIPGPTDSVGGKPLQLRLEFERSPNTLDALYSRELIAGCFLTRGFGRVLTPDQIPDDRAEFTPIREEHHYEARYDLLTPPATGSHTFEGMVYVCQIKESWRSGLSGTRFHYGIGYTLIVEDGKLSEDSTVWLGSLFRNAQMDRNGVKVVEMLDVNPIPEAPQRKQD